MLSLTRSPRTLHRAAYTVRVHLQASECCVNGCLCLAGFRRFFDSSSLSDVTILTPERSFKAHKLLLSYGSEFFDRKLTEEEDMTQITLECTRELAIALLVCSFCPSLPLFLFSFDSACALRSIASLPFSTCHHIFIALSSNVSYPCLFLDPLQRTMRGSMVCFVSCMRAGWSSLPTQPYLCWYTPHTLTHDWCAH